LKKKLAAVSKPNTANKKALDALKETEKKLKTDTANAKKASDAKPKTKKLKDAYTKLAADLAKATKKTKEATKTYDASKKLVTAAQTKYKAAKENSAKLLKKVPAVKAVEPKKGVTAMKILNNMVLKT